MRILLASVGSLGDLHPYLALGLALQGRGHQVSLLTNAEFEPTVVGRGLDFASAGPAVNAAAAAASPNLWHPMKGLGVLWKHVLAPAIVPTFEHIAALAAQGRVTVVAAPSMFGARLARETLTGVTLLSAYSAPSLLRSHIAPLTIADHRIRRGTPRQLTRLIWRAVDHYKLEPMARPALERIAVQLGVDTPLPAPLFGLWIHSPDGGITLFPDWFAPRKPDWPQRLGLGGFPLFDDAGPMPAALQAFLDRGEPPMVFMLGSAMQHAAAFFDAAVDACATLGVRGVLLSPPAPQLRSDRPGDILHASYAPFGALLPQAAALVHHGGIGSCAQGLRAGLPQLVMPMAHDQFDNACQLERLKVGRWIKPARMSGARLASGLRMLLGDAASGAARQRWRDRLAAEPALPRVCDLVERMSA